MANALGWVTVPVVPTFAGVTKKLSEGLVAPAEKAGKQASKAVEQSAESMVSNLEKQVSASTSKLEKYGRVYDSSMAKREAQQHKLNAAIAEQAALQQKYDSARGTSDEVAQLAKLEKAKARVSDETLRMKSAEQAVLDAERNHARQLKDLNDTTEKYHKAQEDLANGASKTSGVFDSIKGSMGGVLDKTSQMGGPLGSVADLLTSFKGGPAAGVVAVAGALGTAAGAAVKFNDDLAKSQVDIQNKLGVTGDKAREMQGQVADALGSGMGDYQSTAESVMAIQQTLGDNMAHMAGQTAGQLSDNFMAFAQTFQVGMSEAVSTVDIMLNTGLVSNAEEGIDLLTAGFQKVPEALQGEVLDATNEYSKFFANMGISGSDAMAMLVKASEQGQYAIDKTGDAIKEFSLKAVDPAVVKTLSEYGVQVDDLAGRVARGGPEASSALNDMVDQLMAIPDEGDRATAAIAAFGTPLEDLSVDQIPKFLEGLKTGGNGMGDFAGASQTMADNTTHTISGMFASMMGHLHGWAIDATLAVDEWAGNVTQAFVKSNFVQAMVDSFSRAWDFIVSGLGWAKDAILAGWDAISEPFSKAYDRIAAPISDAFNKVKDTVSAAWDEITAAFDGGDWGYGALSSLIGADRAEWVVNKIGDVKGAWEEIKAAFTGGDWGYGALADMIGANNAQWILDQIDQVRSYVENLWDWITEKVDQATPLFQAVGDFIKGALGDTFSSLGDTLGSLWESIKSIASSLGSALGSVIGSIFSSLGTVVSSMWSIFKSLFDAIKPIGEFLFNLLVPVLKVVGAVIGGVVVGAVMLFVGALKVVAEVLAWVADKFAWLMDNVLGPLIEILGKVAGFIIETVVTAFSWLAERVAQVFTTVLGWIGSFVTFLQENFWPVVQVVLEALGTAFSAIWDGLSWAWENVLQPVFNGIWELIQVTLGVIATVIIAPLVIAWNVFSSAIQWAWENVIQPVWQAISDFAQETLWPILSQVLDWLGEKWQWLSDTFSAVWSWLSDNVFTPIITFFTETLWPGIQQVLDWLGEKWQWLSETFSAVWTWIDENVLQPLISAFQSTWDTLVNIFQWISDKWQWLADSLGAIWNWIYDNVIQREIDGWTNIWNHFQMVMDWVADKWSWLSDQLQAGWNWIDSNVFTPLKSGLDVVKGWFQSAVDGIVGIWETLKSRLATPINWVIDTVYNNGIRRVWDGVANLLGMEDKKLPEVPSIAFATGGITPGPATPGRDVHRYFSPTGGFLELSGREAVMRPEWTEAMGEDYINEMNLAARRGGVTGVRRKLASQARYYWTGGVMPTQKFAEGGVIDSIVGLVNRFFPGMAITSTYRAGDPGYHGQGKAVDASDGTDDTPGMQALSQFFYENYGSGLLELIHSPYSNNVKNGQNVGDGFGFYGAGTMNEHRNHVHVAASAALPGPENAESWLAKIGEFITSGVSSAVNWVKSKVTSIISSIMDPIKNAIPDAGAGLIGQIPKLAYDKIAGAFIDFVNGEADKKSGGVGAYDGPGGTNGVRESWRAMAMEAMRRNGFNADDPAQVDAMLNQIMSESSGIPNRNQEIVDVNGTGASAGQGLLQIIPTTWASYRDPTLPNDRTDPWANMNGALRYYRARYGGDLTTMWGHGHGYKDGGIIDIAKSLGATLFDVGGTWRSGTIGVNLSGEDEFVLKNSGMNSLGDIARALGQLIPIWKDYAEYAASWMDNTQEYLAKAADYNSEEGTTARSIIRHVLDLGLDLPGSDVVTAVLDGEDAIWDARTRQLGHLDELKEKEEALAEARKNLAELESAGGGVSKDDQRKLDDAQKALDEAKENAAKADSDEKRASAADKVADAEEKLRRVREDVDANSEESAKKHADEITKANEAVTKAEQDYAKARASQVQDLDHLILISQDSILGMIPAAEGLAGQLIGMGVSAGAVSTGLSQVVGALTGIAGVVGPAGISLGLVLSVIKVVVQIVTKIVDAIKQLIDKIYAAREAARESLAKAWETIAKYASLVFEMESNISKLQQSIVRGLMDQRSAEFDLLVATQDRQIAEVEGALAVAQAKMKLDEELENGAKAAQLRLMGLYEDWDSYLSYQAMEAQNTLQQWSDAAISNLYAYEAARAKAVKTELEARVTQIKAEAALATAARANLRNQQDLLTAQERLIKMSAKVAGVDLVGATATSQLTDLLLQLQKSQSAIDKNVLGRLGYKLGTTGPYSDEYRGQLAERDSIYQAIDAVIAESDISMTRAEIDALVKKMTDAAFLGRDPMQVLRANLPEAVAAETALKINDSLKPIYEAKDSETDLTRQVEDLAAEVDLYDKTQSLEQTIKGLEYQVGSLEDSSQAWAEGNEQLRDEYLQSADAKAQAATKLGVSWQLDSTVVPLSVQNQIVKQVTIRLEGERMYSADEIDKLLAEITAGTNVSVVVSRSASEVANARRTEVV